MRSFKLNFLQYRRNRFIAHLSGLLVLLLCCSTMMQAQCPVPPPSPETAIPDNTYLNDGDPAGAACVTLTYDPADTGGAATGISLDIAHTWQGDLTIFVAACGETLNVMQDPDLDGFATVCDAVGGGEDVGDPNAVPVVYENISFGDGLGPDPELGIGNTEVGTGTMFGVTADDPCGIGTVASFAALAAACPAGPIDMQICVGDATGADEGFIQNVQLIVPIPVVCGCDDPTATNFDPLATVNDGSCMFLIPDCADVVYSQPSNAGGVIENGYLFGNLASIGNDQSVLDDFTIPVGEAWEIEELTLVLTNSSGLFAVPSLEISVRADLAGTPGAVLETQVIDAADIVDNGVVDDEFGFDWHRLSVPLNTTITQAFGTYWIEVTTAAGEPLGYFLETVNSGAPIGSESFFNTNGVLNPGSFVVFLAGTDQAFNFCGNIIPCDPIVINSVTVTDQSCSNIEDGSIIVDATGDAAGTLEYSIDGFATSNTTGTFLGLASGPFSVEVRYQADMPCPVTVTELDDAQLTAAIGLLNPGPCELSITDPCTCNNDATPIDLDNGTGGDDGTFGEVVAIPAAPLLLPEGLIFTVAPDDNFLTFTVGIDPALIGAQLVFNEVIPAAGPIPALGTYSIAFNHVDQIGYTMVVEGPFAPGSPFNPVPFLSISNRCAYPNPTFDATFPTMDICATAADIPLGAMDADGAAADAGSPTFSIGANAVTAIQPTVLGAGTYQVNLSFDAADDGNGGVSPDGGITPARPGCVQDAFQSVTIVAAPTIDAVAVVDESCDGANDGSITVTAGGGGTYVFFLVDPVTNIDLFNSFDGIFTNIPDGDYRVEIINTIAPACLAVDVVNTTVLAGANCGVTITDPCSCNNDATVIDLDAGTGGADGTFSETVTIGAPGVILPPGLIFNVVAANPNPGGGVTAGIAGPIAGPVYDPVAGTYSFTFNHVDAIGYNIVIEGPQALGNPGNLFFEIGNNCSYPNPVFNPALPATANCAVPGVIALNANDLLFPPGLGNGFDFLGFTVTGPGLAAPLAVNSIDPAVLGQGTFTVLMTFDGDADANGGIAPPGGTALPGCIQTVQQQIVITCAPANDLCANALPIACGNTLTGNTNFATNTGAPAACLTAANTAGGVWYTWIGDGSNATFSTCGAGTNFDTQIAVTSGGCAVAPVCVGGNDDDLGPCAINGLASSFSFLSTVGTTYHIYVTGFAAATGTFDLSLTCCAPPVAVCSNATVVLSAANPGAGVLTTAMVDGGSTAACGGLNLAFQAGSQTAYSCADVGAGNQQVVTLVATDGFGNTSTCNATITTEDQTAPTVICNAVTVQLDANGIGTLTAAAVLNSAVDNCSTPAQLAATGQLTQSAFNCGELGANTVTLSVTDVNGLTGTCNAAVTVQDMVAPVAVCQDITVQLDATGNAAITGAQLDNGSTDACGPLTFAANPNAFTCANVGANAVILTVSDGSNNSSTCNSVVTVEDNVAPVATCQNVTIMLDANGMASVTAAQVNNGSTDACGPLTLALNQTDFDCDDIATNPNPVTLTVTDANGNSSTCMANITVQDNIPATILCRSNVNTVNDPGVCGADVILLPPLVIEENCSIATIANDAPALFPLGTTLVTWTLTDAGGNPSTCTQNVTINDTEDPVVDCGNSFIAYTSWDNCGYPSYLLEGATATDNCPGVVITNDAPAFFPPGQYMVNYTATDAAGNTAVCMQWVKIYDTTQPQLVSCPDDVEVEATTTTGANASWSLPTGIDNCPGPIILVEENGYAPGDFFELGETAISYRLYDQNGQFIECNFTVSVVPIGALGLDLTCLPDLDISLNNIASTGLFGWNPPLMTSTCEQCDFLASDDFQLIGTLSGHQYYTHTADEMTFAEAIAYAENIGAEIAVLEDKKEVPMIENEMPEGNYFIGLIDAEGTGEFEWTNGDEFVPADFGVLFENDTEEPAAVILNEEGEWEVVLLEDATANFVFEKTCIEWEMDTEIAENFDLETNDDEDLVEAGSVAAITYTAIDECGNVSNCGFEVAFVAEAVAYCEPTGIATDEENPFYIESFSLNGYTVETGDDEGYGDHTDEHFLFTPGEVLDMNTVFAGPNIDELPMYCRIWMDLNNDGDFFDEGELLMQGVDVEEAINELTIPNVNQTVENTVMRIAISRLTYAESCGDFLNGEVEDYTVSIVVPEESQLQINGTGTTTMNGADLGASMLVYPNPAHNELFVRLNNMEAETAILRMYNSVGQLVATQKVATTGAVRLDVSNYTSGLYSVTAEADGEVRLTQKFMVEQQ